jgi:rare lipoprotein A
MAPGPRQITRLHLFSVLLLLSGVAQLTGCARKKVHASSPLGSAPTQLSSEEKVGYASWYGHPYHGRRTSNGETYDMNTMTAAHRTLAFDTVVRVNNLDNGRQVVVRINDRGPFVKDRIIDLSFAAAKELGMVGPGTAKVSLDVLKTVSNPFPLAVQVGSFREESNAVRLQQQLMGRYTPVQVKEFDAPDGVFFRVLVGQFRDSEQAALLLQALKREGREGFMVRLDP